MTLLTYLNDKVHLDPEVEEGLDRLFKREEYPKGQELLQPGNLSKKVYFVEEGLMRSFYLREGKDVTHLFLAENSFYMPIENVYFKEQSPYGLQLLEHCTLRYASYPEVEKYLDRSLELEKFFRYLLIDVLKTLSDRVYTIQFQSARERYQTMIDTYPDILLRAPLGHIASYLGITQQTLSVIRGQI